MSFTERVGLIQVLLLTGCAQPVAVTGQPSGSVVDGMLSRSAAEISAMQYRIHQSGPSAERPGVAVHSITSPSLLLRPARTAVPPAQPPSPRPSAPLLSAGPADGFVRQGGADPTLRAALRKIVPPGHTLVFGKAVAADAPELWQWAGNDRWPYVVNRLLASRGLKATSDEKSKTVTIELAQRALVVRAPETPLSSAVVLKSPGQSLPGGTAKTALLPVTGRNPFRDDTAAKPVEPSVAPAASAVTHVPAVPVSPPAVIQIRHWRIEAGATLKDWLYSQAAAETCTVPGIKNWTVAWLTPVNYRVDAPLTFDGSFRNMLDRLFTLYGMAKVPLYAGVRAAQCVVSVDDKEVQ